MVITGVPLARMTSGASFTNSFAKVRTRSISPPDQRTSNRTLRPSVRPVPARHCGTPTGGPERLNRSLVLMRTPTTRIGSACCARAGSGQATAAPPRSVMNSHRCCLTPSSGEGILAAQTSTSIGTETGMKTFVAVHSQCRCWVIRDDLAGQSRRSYLSVVTPIDGGNRPAQLVDS